MILYYCDMCKHPISTVQKNTIQTKNHKNEVTTNHICHGCRVKIIDLCKCYMNGVETQNPVTEVKRKPVDLKEVAKLAEPEEVVQEDEPKPTASKEVSITVPAEQDNPSIDLDEAFKNVQKEIETEKKPKMNLTAKKEAVTGDSIVISEVVKKPIEEGKRKDTPVVELTQSDVAKITQKYPPIPQRNISFIRLRRCLLMAYKGRSIPFIASYTGYPYGSVYQLLTKFKASAIAARHLEEKRNTKQIRDIIDSYIEHGIYSKVTEETGYGVTTIAEVIEYYTGIKCEQE